MKKKLVIGLVSVATVAGLVVGGVMASTSKAEETNNTPAVSQTNIGQDSQTSNSTTENEVKSPQSNAPTAAQSNKVPTPKVTTPASTPTQTINPNVPVTVSSYKITPEGENEICTLTYTDGTTHDFYSKYTKDGVIAQANCDDSLIGKVKADTFAGY